MTNPPTGTRAKPPKRYGWHRRYNDEDMNPKWRLVAARSGARLVEVLCIKGALNDAAANARKKGSIGGFDIHECAVALDIAPDIVSSVVRALVDMAWLDRSQVIADWLDRQPELEDPTAADRQRKKRQVDAARTRAAIGLATPEDLELLSKPEQEALAKLASMSRVTAAPASEPAVERTVAFMPVIAKEDTHSALEIAREETERAARRWLLGDGVGLVSYGHACAIISRNYGCTRLSADAMLRRWLIETQQEAVALATIISSAYEQGLTGEECQSVIEQRIRVLIEERTAGPKLPFGLTVQRGGKGG